LPSFIAESCVAPQQFNLLIGEFEPAPLRKERTRHTWLAAASILLCSALLSVGFNRRAAAWAQSGEHANETTASTIKQVSTGNTPYSLQLDLEQLRKSSGPRKPLTAPDAAESLAGLLAVWPKGDEYNTGAVSVTPKSINLTVSVDGDARPLLAALKAPTGWRLDEPRLTTSGPTTRVSISLAREEVTKP
jgi:hypothetical protein